MKRPKILLFSGMVDFQAAGNQTFKNTVYHLAGNGFQIEVLTFLPADFSSERDRPHPPEGVCIRRMPQFLACLFHFGRRCKNAIGRLRPRRKSMTFIPRDPCVPVPYFADHNLVGMLSYLVFTFLFFLPCELLRGWWRIYRQRPDLLYGYEMDGAIVAACLGRLMGLPVATRFQGTSLALEDLRSFRGRFLQMRAILSLSAQVDRVIMGNDGTRGDEILSALAVPPERVRFWMNGLDMEHFSTLQPERIQKSDDTHTLLMVSKLKIWKRVDRGIWCLHWLRRKFGREDIRLIVVGDGNERESLESLVDQLGLNDRVEFAGACDHARVADYFRRADVFLSLYDISNLGNPLLEALHGGIPIISLADGSTKLLLEDQKNAFLVNHSEIPGELPRRVLDLLENPDIRERFSAAARQTFEEKVVGWDERMRWEADDLHALLSERNSENRKH